ncbi:hypothetical protein DFP72DRAFT_868285 [Ephemerocybe angulata]|uniref:Uncharacterized protein n=1 Tax=Ephemerocybe angulata TaxID=980116 RepID=A0A8H6IKI3_9AGAR|nr:hypothetical protein DFP72DRAFT_868285 [Tulosesus angulatus]
MRPTFSYSSTSWVPLIDQLFLTRCPPRISFPLLHSTGSAPWSHRRLRPPSRPSGLTPQSSPSLPLRDPPAQQTSPCQRPRTPLSSSFHVVVVQSGCSWVCSRDPSPAAFVTCYLRLLEHHRLHGRCARFGLRRSGVGSISKTSRFVAFATCTTEENSPRTST